MIKKTMLSGVLILVPLVFVAILLAKAFELSMLLAAPLDGLVPIESYAGIALANIIAVILLLILCFVAGLAAHRGPFARRVKRMEDLLIDIIPGYVVAKGVVGGVAKSDKEDSVLKPALVTFDDYQQLAFEVERTGGRAVIFLPGSPSAWSGSSILVNVDRVTLLDLPPHQIVSLLRVMGRGMTKVDLPVNRAGDQ